MECEYKARLANENHFYNQSKPYPFGPGSLSPGDHARALHGISTISSMRDTCLAAKGYSGIIRMLKKERGGWDDPLALATRGLRKMGKERPGALLARRTRTVKLCSFDGRS